jgi:hypothetical protein
MVGTLAGLGGCKSRPPGARMVLPVPKVDLGKLPEEQSAVARFPIRNEGAAPLHIAQVEAGCGCLTPEYPTQLAPGASGEIRVRFQPQPLWSGEMRKEVTVRSDAVGQPEATLTLTVDIQPLIGIEPAPPVVLEYLPGQTFERDLKLTPRSGRPTEIRAPQVNSPFVRAALRPPRPGDPAHAYSLHLSVKPPATGGDFRTTITLSTTEPRTPRLPIEVVGMAQTGVVVSPPEVAIPTMTLGEVGRNLTSLQVFTRTGKFRLLGVETGLPGLQATVNERAPDVQYEVALTYTGGWKPGTVTTAVRIRTDRPDQPVVTVPFRALVQ